MEHEDEVYLDHMLQTARKAIAKLGGRSRAEFDADEDLQIVLAHLVQVIGEAAGRVSEPFKALHAGVPWRRIVGMRHRIVHDYMNINLDILWEVATRNLPDLAAMLSGLRQDGGSSKASTDPPG
jgi:uncharacterized protein with HEPN domain